MKFSRIIYVLLAAALCGIACNPYEIEIPNNNNNSGDTTTKPEDPKPGDGETEEDDYPVKYPDLKTPKVKTLLTNNFFTETKIKEGIVLYSAEMKTCEVTKAKQTVFVLEVDLNNEAYKINFLKTTNDVVSSIGKRSANTIAAINACYEADATYVRTNGYSWPEYTITLDPDHLRFWKHEAAIVGDGKRKIGIVHGAKGAKNIKEGGIQAKKMYPELTEKNIFSSSPMLIDDFDPVGSRFVPYPFNEYTDSQLKSSSLGLDGEDYRRHQGVRHPRVAVALTDDNDLLFVVVDGRFSGKAEGMDADELTRFLVKHFNPRWAINMDGGGSSTMYLKGYGDPENNVLNYPCDNSTWDHKGERARPTVFLVQYDE